MKLKMNKKQKRIITLSFVLGLLLLVGAKLTYSAYFVSDEEKEKRLIDTYNFEQLEKAKNMLKDITQEDIKFRNLAEFNRKYNGSIKPIENCYYMTTTNYFENYTGKSSYIFGFKLESEKYKKKYGEYYTYPKYDLPEDKTCFQGAIADKESDGDCVDMNYFHFQNITSSPCMP